MIHFKDYSGLDYIFWVKLEDDISNHTLTDEINKWFEEKQYILPLTPEQLVEFTLTFG